MGLAVHWAVHWRGFFEYRRLMRNHAGAAGFVRVLKADIVKWRACVKSSSAGVD